MVGCGGCSGTGSGRDSEPGCGWILGSIMVETLGVVVVEAVSLGMIESVGLAGTETEASSSIVSLSSCTNSVSCSIPSCRSANA